MKEMRILFDDQIFRMQPYGGISRYVCEIAAHLVRTPGFAPRVLAPLHVNAYLGSAGVACWGWRLPLRFRGEGQVCRLVNGLVGPLLRRLARPDLIHQTYYPEAGRSLAGGLPTVVTVYDMIHELMPATFAAGDTTAARKRAAVQAADRVICISRHTADDLMRLLDVPAHRIAVIPLGFSADFGLAGPDDGLVGPGPRPYLLYVGARRGHKNFQRLLEAFGASSRLQESFDLLAFGGGALSAGELAAAEAAGVGAGRLRWQQGNDRALAAAYRAARLFVYPSLYEGFGIPPLEAMSCGCPVVCSNASSIPEVVGPAGVYFDPQDAGDLRQALERVAFDEDGCRALRAAGLLRCEAFSWARCAEATAAVYRSVLGDSGVGASVP